MNHVFVFLLSIAFLFPYSHSYGDECSDFSDCEEPGVSLVDYVNSSMPRIHNSVSIISGAWVESATPMSDATAVDPYQLGYGYASTSLDEGTLGDGWDYFHPSEVEIIEPKLFYSTAKANKKLERVRLTSREAGGSTLLFYGDSHGRHFEPQLKGTGFTHVSSIQSPIRQSPFTTKVSWNQDDKTVTMHFADGTERFYEQYDRERFRESSNGYEGYIRRLFRLVKMTLPSGNSRHFRYKHDELVSIETKALKGSVIGKVSFQMKGDSKLVATMSDGRSVTFHYKTLHDRKRAKVVTGIQSEGGRKLKFRYSEASKKHIRRIEEKTSSNGKELQARFFTGEEGSGKKEKAFLQSRVQKLLETTLPGQTKATVSHVFTYSLESNDMARASITEADGSETSYRWNTKSKRVRWVHMKDRNNKPLSSERFVWGAEGEEEGRLLKRILFDENRKPIFMKEWEYNNKGHVVRERIRGYFFHSTSLQNPICLEKDTYQWKSGGDLLEWSAKYDKWGRKTEEVDPEGYRTEYVYLQDNGLLHLKKKYRISPKGEILQRCLYKYGKGDFANICIEEIIDDGSARSLDVLDHVTTRKMTRIQPRSEMPFWGAPLVQEEWVWTPQGGDQLIKKTELIRDAKTGLVTCERLYGTDGIVYASTNFSYDDLGRCVKVLLPDGTKEVRSYDEDTGNLKTVQTPQGTQKYTYDHDDRVIRVKTIYPDGSKTTCHTHYDISGRKVTIIDERGREKTCIRDLLGRIVEEIHPAIIVKGEKLVPKTVYSYAGMEVKKILPNGITEKMQLSSLGKPLKITLSNGATTLYRYDRVGREIERNDPLGVVTRTEYDDFGNVQKVLETVDGIPKVLFEKTYNRTRLLQEKTPGSYTAFQYDSLARISSTVSTDGYTNTSFEIRFLYDSQNRVTHTIHPEKGTQEITSYDRMGRIIEVRAESYPEKSVLSSKKTVYDSLGRISEERALISHDGTWSSSFYQYGQFNTVTSITLPDGTSKFLEKHLQVSGEGKLPYLVEKCFHADGTVEEIWKNSLDIPVLTLSYDPLHRVIQKRIQEIDIMGRTTAILDIPMNPENGEASGEPVRSEFIYDSVGNCVREIRGAGSSRSHELLYRYDAMSRRIEEKKPSGVSISYRYDTKGRLLSQVSSDLSVHYEFSYNDLDLPVLVTDHIHHETVSRSYSGRGSVLEERFSDGSTVSYTHDALGRVSSVSSPFSGAVQYDYKHGFLEKVTYGDHVCNYTARSPIGTAATYQLGALTVEKSHDQSLRLTGVKASSSQSTLFSEERLQFTLKGLVSHSRFITPHNSKPKDEVYRYDALGQIRSDSYHEYQFDSMNRALTLRGRSQSFNALHQLQGDRLCYDIDGRVIRDHKGFTYSYDALDRLTRIEKDTLSIEYRYDAFHRRMSRVKNLNGESESERFIFHGENEVGSYSPSEKKLTSFRVLGEGLGAEIGATLLIVDSSQNVHYAVSDLSGHIRALWNPDTEEVSDWIDYTAFSPSERSPARISPWTFSSKREEPVTGLIYFGRRYYDPDQATWMTLDPLGLSAGPNLYAYVRNNPYMSIDLYGLRDMDGSRGSCRTCFEWNVSGNSNPYKVEREAFAAVQNIVRDRPDIIDTIFNSGTTVEPGKTNYLEQETLEWGGNKVSKGEWHVSGVHLVCREHSMTKAEFLLRYCGQSLGKSIEAISNGMNTTLHTAIARAMNILENDSSLKAVIVLYNSTEGKVRDILESILQVLWIPTQVVKTLRDEYVSFLQDCQANNITFHADVHAHSQGALIYKRIMDYGDDIRSKYTNIIYTYGGAYFIKDAVNFWALPDFVPVCNIFSFASQLLTGFRDVTFAPLRFQSPFTAHGFENPSYQECYNSVD